jgi:soluble lytic murein transglycosylase
MNGNRYQSPLRQVGRSAAIGLVAAAWLLLAEALPAAAGDVFYSYVDRHGTIHFTNVPTDPRFKRIVQRSPYFRHRLSPAQLEQAISHHAQRHRLEPALLRAVIKAESDFDPYAVSRAGAVGLMQLMPHTAGRLDVRDSYDPEDNIGGGARYLRYLLNRYEGNLVLALAAYNAGEKAVDRHQAVPPIQETRLYVAKVLSYYRICLRADRLINRVKQMQAQLSLLTAFSRPSQSQSVASWTVPSH